jgi:tocopherol O-methyltransferase
MHDRQHKDRIRDFYDLVSPYFRDLWGPHLHDGYYAEGASTKEAAQDDLVAYLAASAAIPHGSRGLDVGCGMGATSVWLAKNLGCRMTGVTLSPVQVRIARELAESEGVDAEFSVADAESLETDSEFDFLWMLGVLGHFRDQRSFLNGSERFLRSGGRFVLADWVANPELSDRDRRKYVDPVLDGMLMPDIATVPQYVSWFEESGYKVLAARDIADATRKTWDEGVRISQVPDLYRIARETGRDAVALLRAIRGMRSAMARGPIGYGVVFAEKRATAHDG